MKIPDKKFKLVSLLSIILIGCITSLAFVLPPWYGTGKTKKDHKPSNTEQTESVQEVQQTNQTSEVDFSDFPVFVDTGDPEADNEAYKKAKEKWIADHPDDYARINNPKEKKFNPHSTTK